VVQHLTKKKGPTEESYYRAYALLRERNHRATKRVITMY